MDAIHKILVYLLTFFTYLVTFHDGIKILRNSYKYGKLSNLRVFLVKIAIRLLPWYLREKIQQFPYDDIDIQIKKLNKDRKAEQLNALEHLEQILKFMPMASTSMQDCENIKKIQRAVFKVLWHTKTDSEVVKKSIDMLCGSNHLRFECDCNE